MTALYRADGGSEPSDYDPDEHYDWEPPQEIWGYRAMPDPWSTYEQGVLDGDSWDLLIDLGYNDYRRERIRAAHIDTAEIWGASSEEEHETALEHRDFARAWMKAASESYGDWPLVLRTRGREGKYGRWIGEVFNADGDSIERMLIDEFDGTDYFRWGDLY